MKTNWGLHICELILKIRSNSDVTYFLLLPRLLSGLFLCLLSAMIYLCNKNNIAYNYDEESVKAIIDWAQTAQLPKEVMLSEAEHIFDTSLYVNANICDTKQHYPDTLYNPAIDRLYRLKEFIESNN